RLRRRSWQRSRLSDRLLSVVRLFPGGSAGASSSDVTPVFATDSHDAIFCRCSNDQFLQDRKCYARVAGSQAPTANIVISEPNKRQGGRKNETHSDSIDDSGSGRLGERGLYRAGALTDLAQATDQASGL